MELKEQLGLLETKVDELEGFVNDLSKKLDEQIDSADTQVEVLAGEVATLKESTELLRADLGEAQTATPKKTKEADKPTIGKEFTVDKKKYRFKVAVFRGALESRGGKIMKLRADRLTAGEKKEVLDKYPGVVEEVK